MNPLDLLIGASLMNAMPHFVLGIWKGKMLSGFGLGHTRNILWAIFNFLISVSLFIYKYGIEGFVNQQIYTGALLILITFFCTSYFWYKYFQD